MALVMKRADADGSERVRSYGQPHDGPHLQIVDCRGPLLVACILAASLALQPPVGVTTTAAGQSLSAVESSSPEGESSPEPPAVQTVASEPSPAAPVETSVGVASEPPAAAPGGGIDFNQYVVVPGDTVGAIASRFGVDVYAMLAANGLGAYSIF